MAVVSKSASAAGAWSLDEPPGAVFEAWNGLWEGCLNVHDRMAVLETIDRPSGPDDEIVWRVRG